MQPATGSVGICQLGVRKIEMDEDHLGLLLKRLTSLTFGFKRACVASRKPRGAG